jgi:hypothetical protein
MTIRTAPAAALVWKLDANASNAVRRSRQLEVNGWEVGLLGSGRPPSGRRALRESAPPSVSSTVGSAPRPRSALPALADLLNASLRAYCTRVIDDEPGATTEQIDREAPFGDRVLLVIDGAALQVMPLPATGTLTTVARASATS